MTPPAPSSRRAIKYRGYEMVIEDAEQLAAGSYVTVGTWSFGQIMDHLAKAFDASINGIDTRLPWLVRVLVGPLLKGRLLNKTLPSGFKIPAGDKVTPAPAADVSVEAGLESLRKACQRCAMERQRAFHPLLGNLDRPEWDRFNLRHAELHMSFVVPTDEDATTAAMSDSASDGRDR